MGLLSSLFGGSEDSRLLKALDLAKSGKPEKALEIYNALLAKSTNVTVKARAMFNRALAHSAMQNDDAAIKDLQDTLSLPNLPDNVQTAARSQLARVRKRAEAAS